MLSLIREAQRLPLSDSDLRRLTHDQMNILSYPEVAQARTIEDVFAGKRGVAILYQTENKGDHEVFGHWVLLLKRPGRIPTLEFFDSYGLRVDSELDFVQQAYAIRTGQFGQLVDLMNADSSPYRVVWNHTQLQANNPAIETCGRWICVRFLLSDWPLVDFVSLMSSGSTMNLTADELVTALTLL